MSEESDRRGRASSGIGPDPKLTGQVVLVVGASSGIGAAVAESAANSGAQTVLVARRGEALEKVRAGIRPSKSVPEPLTTCADVRDPGQVEKMVGTVLDRVGRLDAVIYAAGYNVKQRAVGTVSQDAWDEILETNLSGAFHITKSILPVFRRLGGGLLIYLSSMAAKRPDQSGVAYQASKAGLAALAHAVMEECRSEGIRSTVIYPGLTDTPFTLHRPTPPNREELAKALRPGDVAAACQFVLELPARAHVPELTVCPALS